MSRAPWIAVVGLAVAQIVLAQVATERAQARAVTYVFTPLVDVVPGGVPLSASEATLLAAEARNQVDARDIQRAYARLGSTLSLDDLLRGVASLEGTDAALGVEQRVRVRTILERARADHAAVLAVQEEILRDEATLSQLVAELLAALPAEARSRVEARVQAEAGASRSAGAPR